MATTQRQYGRNITEPTGPQQDVLDKLADLGELRTEAVKDRYTVSGRRRLDDLYADIRHQIDRGGELGMKQDVLREALGVSPNAYWKIKRAETGPGEG